MTQSIQRAVVLAAGFGSRLRRNAADCPKPLRPVGAVPLLVRVLLTLQKEGITEAVVVIGYQGERIRRALLSDPRLSLELIFVENHRYDAKNGLSLLAARRFIDQHVILSMSDHLYAPEIVRKLRRMELPERHCALGVDHDIAACADLEDATKVQVEQGLITRISKQLESYNAIDTGVFRVGPSLVEHLAAVADREGDCSLSDGVQALSEAQAFVGCDVTGARWIDVDTPETAVIAESMLRRFGDDLSGVERPAPTATEQRWLPRLVPGRLVPAE